MSSTRAYALSSCIRLLIVSVSAATTLPAPALSRSAQPLVLKPTSKWLVDYQRDSCSLSRTFADGKNNAEIVMTSFSPSGRFKLILVGKIFQENYPDKIYLQFGPNEAPQRIAFIPVKFGKEDALALQGKIGIAPTNEADVKTGKGLSPDAVTPLPPVTSVREKAVTLLKLGRPLAKDVVLETGAMAKPFAALAACVDDMVRSWGLDPEKHKLFTRFATPKNNPAFWMSSSDYPVKMLNEGQPGLVEFRLIVDEAGRATGCKIQMTTRDKEFDDVVCAALTRNAKFIPALDERGQPTKSYYQNGVRFEFGL